MAKYIMFNMETQAPRVVEGGEADALYASASTPPEFEDLLQQVKQKQAERRGRKGGNTNVRTIHQ